MKKLIIVAMIAACVALCAAVWPHGNAVEETPVPAAETTVSAKEATVGEIEEPAALAEKEKGAVPQQEASQEERPEPEPTPSQPPKELQPGEKVYVAGFGWVEYEGPNYCEDGTDIYENGNKIGITG